MAAREASIEKYLGGLVAERGGLYIKLVPFSLRGVPDRLIVLPGGVVQFVELKRPSGGKIGPLQVWWRDRLLALGCRHAFVKSRQEADQLIEEFDA